MSKPLSSFAAPVPTESISGMGGKGTLHHSYGHGEYLDVMSIRKARLAVGIAEDVPSFRRSDSSSMALWSILCPSK